MLMGRLCLYVPYCTVSLCVLQSKVGKPLIFVLFNSEAGFPNQIVCSESQKVPRVRGKISGAFIAVECELAYFIFQESFYSNMSVSP